MISISANQLTRIFPTALDSDIAKFKQPLSIAMEHYNINTLDRAAAFIAQIGHESGAFRYVRELATGQKYEGRKDLGNDQPGDGVKFKGRGLIQITGRDNYVALDSFFGLNGRLIENPSMLEAPVYAVSSACWYWNTRKLNDIADQGPEWRHTSLNEKTNEVKHYDKFQWITIKINGGLNGYAERLLYYNRAKILLRS